MHKETNVKYKYIEGEEVGSDDHIQMTESIFL
jgi:hypothetical protein